MRLECPAPNACRRGALRTVYRDIAAQAAWRGAEGIQAP